MITEHRRQVFWQIPDAPVTVPLRERGVLGVAGPDGALTHAGREARRREGRHQEWVHGTQYSPFGTVRLNHADHLYVIAIGYTLVRNSLSGELRIYDHLLTAATGSRARDV